MEEKVNKIKILEERHDLLILLINNRVVTKPYSPYFVAKYKHFDGNRIIYKFDGQSYVSETFDDGIFNCFFMGEVLQLRRKEEIAKVILEHHETGNTKIYEDLFRTEYAKQYKVTILNDLIRSFGDRVQAVDDKYFVVDEIFRVDDKGVANVRSEDGTWKHLCIVVKGAIPEYTIDTKIGPVKVEQKGTEILAKVGYLLSPDITDNGLVTQLPKYVQQILGVPENPVPLATETTNNIVQNT